MKFYDINGNEKGNEIVTVPPQYKINNYGVISLVGIDIKTINYSFECYYCDGCIDTPTGSNGWMSVKVVSKDYTMLTYYELTGNIYKRLKSGSWGNWTKIA
ncbi:MAG: hypothetical protein RR802_05980 [Erysipelotrichaceae bacterium]